jgi:NTP pyrophosphatase (non-canonical NTP hydrolase)
MSEQLENWVYIKSEPNLYTVGFYGPDCWHPDSDHQNRDDAANRVHYLNGVDQRAGKQPSAEGWQIVIRAYEQCLMDGQRVPHELKTAIEFAKRAMPAQPPVRGEGEVYHVGSTANIRATWIRLAGACFDDNGEVDDAEVDKLIAYGKFAPPVSALRELTFAEFARINRQRCESPDGFNHKLESWSTSDWFLALLGELGEAANIAKKLNRVRDGIPGNKISKKELQDKLRQELGDAFVYLDLLCQSVGIEIESAAVEVFNAKSQELGCPIRIPAALAAALKETQE